MEKRSYFGDTGCNEILKGWLVGTTDYMDAVTGKQGKYFSAYKSNLEEAKAYAKATGGKLTARIVSVPQY